MKTLQVRKMLLADILELMRMPDKAQLLREFEPEPDPVQEQLQKLELERLQREPAVRSQDSY